MAACEFCQSLPKVELHAHLTGSYSSETVQKLAAMAGKSNANGELDWIKQDNYGFDEVFKYFALAQAVTCTQEAVYIAARDVINEFAQDNVRYLELRTTPKNDGTMSPSEYIAAIVKAMEESSHNYNNMIVKLILSIDRRRSLEAAATSLRLASEFRQHVVGIDLSGDPRVNDAQVFIPVLRQAQLADWRLALHLAEVDKMERETEAVLNALRPDRIGHGTFIKDSLAEKVHASGIPLELCITSNIYGQTATSADDHHINYWHGIGHPVAVCTDDKGAFRTTVSHELHLAHQSLFVGATTDRRGVASLVQSGLDAAFLTKANATVAEWNCMCDMREQLARC